MREVVAQEHSLQNPDAVIEMDKIRVNQKLDIEIPNLGTFRMTRWAQRQLGTTLGVNWKKWFNPTLVTPEVIQEELQRRFSKTGDKRKIRTTRFRNGAPGIDGCDGYMRAVLSPTYYPIDNERLFDRLEAKFGYEVTTLRFMGNHLSQKVRWSDDRCSHFTVVGDRINMGAINRDHEDPKVREIYDVAEAEGMLPKEDIVYPGFHMRNSEVGYSALIVDEFSFRLVCLNGMMITTGDSRLLYRRHRPIEDAELDKRILAVFDKIPVRWEDTRKRLGNLQTIVVENPTGMIEDELSRLNAPKKFRNAAVEAFNKEPLKTRYGVVQAITRAAQDYEDMNKRFDMEAMAGSVMRRLSQ